MIQVLRMKEIFPFFIRHVSEKKINLNTFDWFFCLKSAIVSVKLFKFIVRSDWVQSSISCYYLGTCTQSQQSLKWMETRGIHQLSFVQISKILFLPHFRASNPNTHPHRFPTHSPVTFPADMGLRISPEKATNLRNPNKTNILPTR